MIRQRVLLAVFLCFCSCLSGWWDTGHMVIAEIAKSQMSRGAIERVEGLIGVFSADFPESSGLLTAACFADDIASRGLCGFKVWHGRLTPYDPEGILSEHELAIIHSLIEPNSIVYAVQQSIETLCNPLAGDWEKSFMLRFLLHTVGDLHQPMHCIQMFSSRFPMGDFAGHHFPLKGEYPTLHILWDAMLGLNGPRLVRPLTAEGVAWIQTLANEVSRSNPPASFVNLECFDPKVWSAESYELAICYAYQGIEPDGEPSALYLEEGRCCAKRQIALAGYRLGMILEQLFG